jgi:hypothetical protein
MGRVEVSVDDDSWGRTTGLQHDVHWYSIKPASNQIASIKEHARLNQVPMDRFSEDAMICVDLKHSHGNPSHHCCQFAWLQPTGNRTYCDNRSSDAGITRLVNSFGLAAGSGGEPHGQRPPPVPHF